MLRSRLLSQSGVVFGARLFGAGLIFLAQAAIARTWGADILGEYLLIVAAANLIGVVLPLGFETIGTYFAAEYRARGQGHLLRGFARRAFVHIGLTGVVVFVAGLLILDRLGPLGEMFARHWTPTMIMAVAAAMVYVNSALLVGLRHPLAGFFADGLFRPMLVVLALGIATLSAAPDAFGTMIWILAIGFAAIAAAQLAYMAIRLRSVPGSTETVPAPEARRWWRFAVPWVLIAIASDYFFDLDLLMLAGLLPREDLAIFGVTTRIFALVAFGVAAVYAVILPDVFEAEAKADRAEFHRRIGEANLIATGLAASLFVAVAALGPVLLMLFGPAFAAGAAPLAVLCLALVVRAAFGPAAVVLSIHDRPYATLPAIGLGLAALVAGNLLLVPGLGIMGAALAALVAITLWSAALWATARWVAGIDVSIVARLRGQPSTPTLPEVSRPSA